MRGPPCRSNTTLAARTALTVDMRKAEEMGAASVPFQFAGFVQLDAQLSYSIPPAPTDAKAATPCGDTAKKCDPLGRASVEIFVAVDQLCVFVQLASLHSK
jgi:hypothetical protein